MAAHLSVAFLITMSPEQFKQQLVAQLKSSIRWHSVSAYSYISNLQRDVTASVKMNR